MSEKEMERAMLDEVVVSLLDLADKLCETLKEEMNRE